MPRRPPVCRKRTLLFAHSAGLLLTSFRNPTMAFPEYAGSSTTPVCLATLSTSWTSSELHACLTIVASSSDHRQSTGTEAASDVASRSIPSIAQVLHYTQDVNYRELTSTQAIAQGLVKELTEHLWSCAEDVPDVFDGVQSSIRRRSLQAPTKLESPNIAVSVAPS